MIFQSHAIANTNYIHQSINNIKHSVASLQQSYHQQGLRIVTYYTSVTFTGLFWITTLLIAVASIHTCHGEQQQGSPVPTARYFYPAAGFQPSPLASSHIQPYPFNSHVGQWTVPSVKVIPSQQGGSSSVVEASSALPFHVASQRSSAGGSSTASGYQPAYYLLHPYYHDSQQAFYAPAFQPYSQQQPYFGNGGLVPLLVNQQANPAPVFGFSPTNAVPLPPPINHGE
jgi:hypothetical protein